MSEFQSRLAIGMRGIAAGDCFQTCSVSLRKHGLNIIFFQPGYYNSCFKTTTPSPPPPTEAPEPSASEPPPLDTTSIVSFYSILKEYVIQSVF